MNRRERWPPRNSSSSWPETRNRRMVFKCRFIPLCNPTGLEDNTRHSRRGRDLNREFWKGSPEPEVRGCWNPNCASGIFHGLVQLHADDTSEGLYGFVRGHTLTENLLRPACAARPPRFCRPGDGIIYKHYEGCWPLPAEIELQRPSRSSLKPRSSPRRICKCGALLLALQTIMSESPPTPSPFAQNI